MAAEVGLVFGPFVLTPQEQGEVKPSVMKQREPSWLEERSERLKRWS